MRLSFILFILLILLTSKSFGQESKREMYKGLPVLLSGIDTLYFEVGEYKSKGWIVSPKVDKDSLRFGSLHALTARFISDVDSISYLVSPGESKHFYVKLKDQYAYTVIYNRASLTKIAFHKEKQLPDSIQFLFDKEYATVPYFLRLRNQYPFESNLVDAKDDASRVLNILHWVHNQWKHNGNLAPQKNDAISILEEAKEGKGFPCFAYAEVLRATLNSVGIPTRRLALKTKDVETQNYASGHVANEVWLRDLKKWVFADPQEDVIPYLNGIPLSAVELQEALTTNLDAVEFKSLSNISKDAYVDFIYPYLYYFDTNYDHRYADQPKQKYTGMSSMMLVPVGAKNPVKAGFYSDQKIDYCIYTHSLKDFYKEPTFK